MKFVPFLPSFLLGGMEVEKMVVVEVVVVEVVVVEVEKMVEVGVAYAQAVKWYMVKRTIIET